MAVKVFVLGRPGSGKSAVTRNISALARDYGWLPCCINDYSILNRMFQADTEHKQFRPTLFDGFEVVDASVLDTALKEMEKIAQGYVSQVRNLLLIEFARNDYRKALKQFSTELLRDAYFLFIYSDLDVCIQRIYNRTIHPTGPDDTFVSGEVIRGYYYRNYDRPFMISHFAKRYNTYGERVKFIENTGTLKDFHQKIYEFAETLLEQETYLSRETDPMSLDAISSLST